MGTIYLDQDTLISNLMPSGGGALEAGDTIQLEGHSLIIDEDAVSYPVTIANSGTDANLELRDLGRIKLNAPLPVTVRPWIDPAHPLPVAAEPGIDGDPYRTNLTANARAEIQLVGNFGLGGGAASLPTEVRGGNFYATTLSTSQDARTLFLDRDIPLHAGDILSNVYYKGMQTVVVTAYDSANHIVTVDSDITRQGAGEVWCLVAGGVLVNAPAAYNRTGGIIDSPVSAGALFILAKGGEAVGVSAVVNRLVVSFASASNNDRPWLFSNGAIVAEEYAGASLFRFFTNNTFFESNDCCPVSVGYSTTGISNGQSFGRMKIGRGRVDGKNFSRLVYNGNANYEIENAVIGTGFQTDTQTATVHLKNCNYNGNDISDVRLENAGTITRSNNADYHAPATASDVTWRYADRTVAPGATLRLQCAWLRAGAAATRACVAVTDPATWWPSLWPIGAGALASVEFTGGTADWRSELLTWRNESAEAATVRVWECVTGTVAGGYLRTEEVKGGAL